ncbi:hypothetical protein [Micromonospora sp. MW-13]|uniref:hypothetical protein n=1 Tax=Micromonospora sp. MW-13 TaxID=2094022 RepID=UPI000FFEAF9E|nr:hypothetical protein [Micromonospora sp. MW-13]
MTGDRVMSDGSRPFQERVRHLRDAWALNGRGRAFLVSGTSFFAVYCWSLNYRIGDPTAPAYDAELAEFVAASYELNGGSAGWNAMLNGRETCSTCHDWYRLENLGICTGCLRHTCYGCGDHERCAGELL